VTPLTKSGGLIDEIGDYLAEDLAAVERHLDTVLESDTDLVREVGEYIRSSHGKRLRPVLVLLASRAFGYSGEEPPKVAAALELIHTATLLHDDVIDKAPLRRGKQTVNTRWGDDVAILIADYLFSHSFSLAMQALNPVVLSTITQVTSRMCEGELFQIQKRDALLTREEYLHVVRSKTAFLFSACTGLGSVLAQASEEQTLEITKFGLNFGVAFQITDDALDFAAKDEQLGKELWTDIRNGKQTLPLIHAFETAAPADREELWNCWNNGRETECILRQIQKYRGVEAALAEARNFATKAKSHLAALPSTRAADYCAQLSDYVASRTY